MKKKFSLWFNIATICLCVCAIAIGVYAATSATLTVSGTIGFEAHGCTGSVSGTIVGHAQKDGEDHQDGMPVEIPASLGEAVNFGQTLSYGSRFFTDMATTDGSVTPITIVLTVTNTSLFPIEGQLVLPETEFAKAIDFDVESGLIQLAPTNTTDDKDVGTITITMKLKSTSTNYATPLDLNFTVKFNKYTQVKHDEATGYYMIMGSNVVTNAQGYQQVEEVKWLPFAENNGTEEAPDWEPFVNTNKPDTTKEHYWISEKVLDITGTGAGNSGVPFNPYINYSTAKDTRPELSTQNPNIYLTSNVRDILQGEDAYATAKMVDMMIFEANKEKKVNLMKEYGIFGYVYENISARTAMELFGATVPDTLLDYNTNNDRLWLLSGEELKYLINDMSLDYTTYPTKPELATETFRGATVSLWWLRSPYANNASNALFINTSGRVSNSSVYDTYGIRPAFKF